MKRKIEIDSASSRSGSQSEHKSAFSSSSSQSGSSSSNDGSPEMSIRMQLQEQRKRNSKRLSGMHSIYSGRSNKMSDNSKSQDNLSSNRHYRGKDSSELGKISSSSRQNQLNQSKGSFASRKGLQRLGTDNFFAFQSNQKNILELPGSGARNTKKARQNVQRGMTIEDINIQTKDKVHNMTKSEEKIQKFKSDKDDSSPINQVSNVFQFGQKSKYNFSKHINSEESVPNMPHASKQQTQKNGHGQGIAAVSPTSQQQQFGQNILHSQIAQDQDNQNATKQAGLVKKLNLDGIQNGNPKSKLSNMNIQVLPYMNNTELHKQKNQKKDFRHISIETESQKVTNMVLKNEESDVSPYSPGQKGNLKSGAVLPHLPQPMMNKTVSFGAEKYEEQQSQQLSAVKEISDQEEQNTEFKKFKTLQPVKDDENLLMPPPAEKKPKAKKKKSGGKLSSRQELLEKLKEDEQKRASLAQPKTNTEMRNHMKSTEDNLKFLEFVNARVVEREQSRINHLKQKRKEARLKQTIKKYYLRVIINKQDLDMAEPPQLLPQHSMKSDIPTPSRKDKDKKEQTPFELNFFSNIQNLNFRIGNLFSYNLKLIPLDINARGEGRQFRALPKLDAVRLFAFVKREVFLQEPVSTCFSFLLKFRVQQSQHPSCTSGKNKTDSLHASGCYMMPSEELFQSLSNNLMSKSLLALCEVDTEFFGLIDPLQVRLNNKDHCFLRLQVFQKHDKIPWQTDISTMLFTLIEQRSIKNSLFSIQKYMEVLPRYQLKYTPQEREIWANHLASALIQIRVQGKQSECRKKVLTAMEIAQVLYDQQFVTYLRKTFLEDNCNGGGNNNNVSGVGASSQGLASMSQSAAGGPNGAASNAGFYTGNNNHNNSSAGNMKDNTNKERASTGGGVHSQRAHNNNDNKSGANAGGKFAGQKRNFKQSAMDKNDFSEAEMPPTKRSRNE